MYTSSNGHKISSFLFLVVPISLSSRALMFQMGVSCVNHQKEHVANLIKIKLEDTNSLGNGKKSA